MKELQQSTPERNRRLFFSGVLLLSGANITVKIIGLLFKIPMSHFLLDEGMGYFNAAYQIYTWLYMLCTAGLPVAISILISEARAKGDAAYVCRVRKLSLYILLTLGCVATALMLFGAVPLAHLIGSPGSCYAIMAIAPTLLFICLSSALRGYFQGFQQMGPPAFSGVLEALGKLAVGVLFAAHATRAGQDLPHVAAAAVSGLAVGEAMGFFYLLWSCRFYEKKGKFFYLTDEQETIPQAGMLARLLKISMPITASAMVMSISGLLDLLLIGRRLQSVGYTVQAATAFYGNYTTLVVPMFNLPVALVYPLTTAIVPLLSATVAGGRKETARRTVASVMRIAVLIAMPCAMGLSVFSRPILRLFFPPGMVEGAAPMLSVLAPGVLFLSLLTVTNAVLQAGGHAYCPMISMGIGAVIKTAVAYVLIGIPSIGPAGIPIGTLVCYFVVFLINLYVLLVRLSVTVPVGRTLLLPALSALFATCGAYGVYQLMGGDGGGHFLVLIAIVTAVILYGLAVLLTRTVTQEDVAFIPFGRAVVRFLPKNKHHVNQ